MTKVIFNSAQTQIQKTNHFRSRLRAKLFVVFFSFVLAVARLSLVLSDDDISSAALSSFMYSLPFLFALSIIILTEYLLYRKYGLAILKYSKIIDVLLILTFIGDWMFSLNGSLKRPKDACFTLPAAIAFASFSWRTLILLLITQYWQLKIIPPIAAYTYLMTYAAVHQPDQTLFILVRGILQILFVIGIFYFEYKINFVMALGNVQQEQWLKLNEFILNNIPENIVIMDLDGNCNFVGENFKKLMRRACQPLEDIKQFFRNIKDIQRQQREDESESYNSDNIIEISPSNQERRIDEAQEIASLEVLLSTFGDSITSGSIRERSVQIYNGKFQQQDSSAEERSYEIKISFIKQESSGYILLILRDTTYRDQILTLEGNIKYKDHLLASVSHELRTPLNGNINLIEAAIKSRDTYDKIKDCFLIPAVKSSKFLLHLINDILDMSQMKAQKLRLVFQQASLRDTLISTIQLLELHAKKKGLDLQTDINLDSQDTFCTDHVRLSQIILNLLNNAIKFTQTGLVKLSALTLEDPGQVQISIKDTGIGITEENIGKLFKDFTHIDLKNSNMINPSGVGLGLKISNDLVKLLGPKDNQGITVSSEVNTGSIFSFIIENKEAELSLSEKSDPKGDNSPLVANEFPTGSAESLLAAMTARNTTTKSIAQLTRREVSPITTRSSLCSCAKVLVVDDDPFNMMAYEAILNSFDMKYECAYSGRSAIEKMLNKVRYPCSNSCSPYKLVFMDEEMPGMTGRETVAEIANLQKQNLLPSEMNIVGCTAHSNGEEIEKFLKSGIVEFIPKPISVNTIKEILEKYNVFNSDAITE